MSPISIVLFIISFVLAGILFGNTYKKFNIEYNTLLIITIISAIVFFAQYIYEKIFKKKKQS